MTTLRILTTAAVVGLVAWWLISLAPADWHGWILLGAVLFEINAVIIQNSHRLADLHKLHWLQRAERLDAMPPDDTHLRAGLVEPDVARLTTKDDESIRRALVHFDGCQRCGSRMRRRCRSCCGIKGSIQSR